MVTVKQYAEKLGVAVSTIRQMCANAVLPSVKIGNSYRIFEEEADAYFRQQWLDKKAERERREQRREQRRTIVKCAAKGNSSNYLERLAELKKEVLSI